MIVSGLALATGSGRACTQGEGSRWVTVRGAEGYRPVAQVYERNGASHRLWSGVYSRRAFAMGHGEGSRGLAPCRSDL